MIPQTALSAVWTAPSTQPGVHDTSSPAMNIPFSSAGMCCCMK